MTTRPVGRTTRHIAGPAGLLAAVLALTGTAAAAGPPGRTANQAGPPPGVQAVAQPGAQAAAAAGGQGSELSATTRLADRRSLVVGDRAYAMGDESGLYPATGWHIRGEMGGFWTQPLKLLDGLWFGVDGSWLGKDVQAASYTSGHGYQRID